MRARSGLLPGADLDESGQALSRTSKVKREEVSAQGANGVGDFRRGFRVISGSISFLL